jgi:hypothetical protein
MFHPCFNLQYLSPHSLRGIVETKVYFKQVVERARLESVTIAALLMTLTKLILIY